ncbi:hypothetical protein KAU08_06025, partial [bacterium]|nr:hypothetical protein [bacterium]
MTFDKGNNNYVNLIPAGNGISRLPPVVPENVRMVLSTLPGRPLDDLKKREWQTMEVFPLSDGERTKLMSEYLDVYSKSLDKNRLKKVASSDQTRNPLYLRSLLEELSVFGVHEHLDRAIEHYISSETIPELFEKVLRRIERDYETEWPGLVEDAMTCIWASRRGLAEEELLELLGAGGHPLPRPQWSQFFDAVEKLFVDRSRLIGFSHDYVREAIANRYLQKEKDQQAVHLHLADYFSKQELTPRKVDELPWQLVVAESWQQLYDLLADLEFFNEAWEENKLEVKAYWAKIENSSDLNLVDAYQCVLDAPEAVPDSETLMRASDLLNDTGHLLEALSLMDFLSEYYRKTGDELNLATSLGGQGYILFNRGELDNAMELNKESERICRELD